MRTLWIGAAAAASAMAHPMTPVVTILKDMVEQLEKDAKQDAKDHKKAMCTAEAAIKKETLQIETQTAAIKTNKEIVTAQVARKGELETKLKLRKEELEKLTTEFAAAAEQRKTENEKYVKDIANLEETISALGQAIKILSVNNYKSLAQVVDVTSKVVSLTKNKKLQKLVAKLDLMQISNGEASFLQAPAYQNYAAQSSQIMGMLEEMEIQFKQEEKQTHAQEKSSAEAYAEYKTKTQELIDLATTDIAENLEPGIADAEEKRANAVVAVEEATKLLADAEIALDTVTKQKAADEESYAARTTSRAEEVSAVQETIAILDDPKFFELSGKTISFLQTSSKQAVKYPGMGDMVSVVALLDSFAEKDGGVALAQAYARSGAAFDKVINAIHGVLQKIKKERKEDNESLAQCDVEDKALSDKILELTTQQEQQENELATLQHDIEMLKKKSEMTQAAHEKENYDMKMAASDRAKMNDQHQTALVNQRATIDVLTKALDRMKQKYGPPAPALADTGFLQAPSVNPSGQKVIDLLSGILKKSQETEKSMLLEERTKQMEYEKEVQVTNALLRDLEKILLETEKELAKTEKDEAATAAELESTKATRAETEETFAKLTQECKFIRDNIGLREKNRVEEETMLNQAIDAIQTIKGSAGGSPSSMSDGK